LQAEASRGRGTCRHLKHEAGFFLTFQRIQRVLYSFYDSPCLGVFHWYTCDPNQTYIFTKKEGRDPPAVVVHLFTPETRLLLFEGSQLKIFKTWHAPNGLLVVANAALRKAGIMGKEVELKCGGM
jgi:hypothetical protein